MAANADVGLEVGEVTDDDFETIMENGWVKLPGLVGHDLAHRVLDCAKQLMGEEGEAHIHRVGLDEGTSPARRYRFASRDDAFLRSFVTAREFGRNSARLLGRDSSIRLLADTLAVTPPASQEELGQPIRFNQGYFGRPIDRGRIAFWIAPDPVTPDQGPLQFYTGSHKIGPLGLGTLTQERRDIWARLQSCPLSEPDTFAPGDAIAFLSGVVQGSAANASTRPRWSYVLGYFPADGRYVRFPCVYTDGLDLKAWDIIDHPNFPLVYQGTAPEIPMGTGEAREKPPDQANGVGPAS